LYNDSYKICVKLSPLICIIQKILSKIMNHVMQFNKTLKNRMQLTQKDLQRFIAIGRSIFIELHP